MAGVSYCYLTVVLVYIFIRLTLLRISFRCIRLRILTSDDARVFKELPQLISNSIHLHFGRSFVMESTNFPFFQFLVRRNSMQSFGTILGIKASLETAQNSKI